MGAQEPGGVVVEGFAPVDFDAFRAEHHSAIARALVLSLRRASLAEQAAVEGFGRALHQWDRLQSHRHPEGWVFRAALDWARRRVRHHPPLERPTAGATPHPGFDGGLDRALGRLDLNDRTIAVLRHYLAWPPGDVAAALRVPRLAVHWRLRVIHRALGRDAMIPADEVATRLAWHLTAVAAELEIAPPAVAAIRRPARRRGRWVVIGALILAALVFATIALLAPGEDEPPVTTDVGDGGLAAEVPGGVGDSPVRGPVPAEPGPALAWQRAELPADAAISHVIAVDDRFLAFDGFLEPGGATRRIWTSRDGITWSPEDADLDAFHPGEVVYAVAAYGAGVVAVGARPPADFSALPPVAPLVVWLSGDGAQWRRAELPASAEAPPAPGLGWAPGYAAAAAGDLGILMATFPIAAVDTAALPQGLVDESLLAAGFTLHHGHEGFEVTDPYGLVAGHVSYEDLGASEESVLGPVPSATLWFSPDGAEWQPATMPPDLAQGLVGHLAATDEGFQATGISPGGRPSSWSTADGLVWTADDPPLGRPWTEWGEGSRATTVPAASGIGPTVALLNAGTNESKWVALPAGGIGHDAPMALFGGPLGLLAYALDDDTAPQPPLEVTIERDGRRFTQVSDPGRRSTVTDTRTGEDLFEVYGHMPGTSDDLPVDVSARTFSVLDPATGEVLFTAGWDDWRRAWQEAPSAWAEVPAPTASRIWFSTDGRRWSHESPDEAFGRPGFVAAVAVGSDRVVLVHAVASGLVRLPIGGFAGAGTLGVWAGTVAP